MSASIGAVPRDTAASVPGALITLWREYPDQVRDLSVQQIVKIAGAGRLLDGSRCSADFRCVLAEMDASDLERFVSECLEKEGGKGTRKGFEDSGFVLQDVVNEIGRRLDFQVINGLYQGRKGVTGCDGIWKDASGIELVVEVKTTDTYSIPLDVVERYRERLSTTGEIGAESFVLFVVGRDDTGALEAQIRGSRHAWTMRMTGAASLVRLLQVKVNAESPKVAERIRSILKPIEYTRVDRIADLMFEVRADTDEPLPNTETTERLGTLGSSSPAMIALAVRVEAAAARLPSGLPTPGIETIRQDAADIVSRRLGVRLTRRRRSLFETSDDKVHAIISVSKRYERDYQSYWYAFYDTQRDYLAESGTGFFVLCAADTSRVWSIPYSVIAPMLDGMNSTTRADGQIYWHILTKLDGKDCLLVGGGELLSLAPTRFQTRTEVGRDPAGPTTC